MTKQDVIKEFKSSFGSDLEYITYVRLNGRTTTRCAFVDFVDYLHRDGRITDKQAQNITASDKDLFIVKGVAWKGDIV